MSELTISFKVSVVGFPMEPWNWVSFLPQPTAIGFSERQIMKVQLEIKLMKSLNCTKKLTLSATIHKPNTAKMRC